MVATMPYDDITLTREKLYEDVWTRPVTQVAKDIGISDVAVAKICRKLNVPVPARGYWARVAAGQPRKKPALPPASSTTPQSHRLRRWRAPVDPIEVKVAQQDAPAVTVPPSLESPHRLVRTSQAFLQRVAKEDDGRSRPKGQALNVSVSSTTLDRALRVVDALVKALEERGHGVEVREVNLPVREHHYGAPPPAPEPEWHTVAVVGETAVRFGLEEGYDTIELPPPPPTGARETRSWDLRRPVKERIPNGRLTLTILNSPGSERRTLSDTKGEPIEARLGSFILLVEAVAVAIREAEAKAVRRAEERRREEEEYREAQEHRRREEALVKDLDERLNLWLAAGRYRQLAEAIEAMPATDGEEERRASWLAWLRSYAERVERAVVHKLPDPERGPEPSWRY
jgi:hypothetical protein